MDTSAGLCLTNSARQQGPAELLSKSTPPFQAHVDGTPGLSVSEDDDEPCSDAREISVEHEQTIALQRVARLSRDSDRVGSTSSVPVSALDALMDRTKDMNAKGTSQTSVAASVEESHSTVLDTIEAGDAQIREQRSSASPVVSTSPTSSALSPLTGAQSMSSPDLPSSCTSTHASHVTAQSQSSLNLEQRRSRRRSAIDSFSTNRLSGFWQNFINRRPDSSSMKAPDENFRSGRNHAKVAEEITRTSNASNHSQTPPPALPAPCLQDLGLSLTALTSVLTTTHFNSAPTSGTFLMPHYLLLCHSQGLDVLPLVSPPSPQPYALVRKVNFKSVVVMEEKGVLVAIAGRRDVVRVYALDEIKKAINWRLDVEIRREKDRLKRDQAKQSPRKRVDKVFGELAVNYTEDKPIKGKLADPSSSQNFSMQNNRLRRKKAVNDTIVSDPPAQLRSGSATSTHKGESCLNLRETCLSTQHRFDPPPYRSPSTSRTSLHLHSSTISTARSSSGSGPVSDVLRQNSTQLWSARAAMEDGEKMERDSYSSDEEAINIATAGPSGSAALEERTSSLNRRNSVSSRSADIILRTDVPHTPGTLTRSRTSSTIAPTVRNRPLPTDSSLSLNSMSAEGSSRPQLPQNPSVWTVRPALTTVPLDGGRATSDVDGEDDAEEDDEPISFAQALSESRIPGLPPPGSRQQQEAIVIGSENLRHEPQSLSRDSASDTHTVWTTNSQDNNYRAPRRRWSILNGMFSNARSMESFRTAATPVPHPSSVSADGRIPDCLTRVSSADAVREVPHMMAVPSTARRPGTASSCRDSAATITGATVPSNYRFLPRILVNAFQNVHSENRKNSRSALRDDTLKKQLTNSASTPPAPKLDNIKLPGTKGAIMIKAVETAKKSFLAILCGERGEKVELFAGTYKTTLGLSRTFILPDSPRSLELQLQGDDLVEVFLVFSQNVFGLEPATVRVREVRIERAERRAARRRAREIRVEEHPTTEANGISLEVEEMPETTVSVSVSIAPSDPATTPTLDDSTSLPSALSGQPPESHINVAESLSQTASVPQAEELVALMPSHSAPYTTFQQLSFAPPFPLAAIADEFIIPPTYRSFLEYRTGHEPNFDRIDNIDLANVRFSPPGLPLPPALPPSKWYYRDPKGVVQGPWKASLMQSWYKEGLLPPDLPVRRAEDTEYLLLRDLRMQSVDPTHPFRSPPVKIRSPLIESHEPLLHPISLLTQSRRYGPPALFYSTRGGHSTSIVDSRGRSVLRGRLHWSNDDDDEDHSDGSRLGDVKRLEAFDVGNSAVVVAIRQGGVEVTSICDALLAPGDLSRSFLPNFKPPGSNVSRRSPFIWRVGTPLSAFAHRFVALNSHQSISKPTKLNSFSGNFHSKNELGLGNSDDIEARQNEDLVFLGRVEDNVYFCERSNGSYRILRLSPSASLPSTSSSPSSSSSNTITTPTPS